MSHKNCWADIPREITDEILGYCDKPSLLVLGQVNYHLNFCALSRYFGKEICDTSLFLPSSSFSCGSSLRSEHRKFEIDESMRALGTALWLPKAIQSIYYVSPAHFEYNQYIKDLRYLIKFLHRMPELILLNIRTRFYSTGTPAQVDRQVHHAVWNRLIAVAILKGCVHLEVNETGLFGREGFLHCVPPTPLRTSLIQPKSWFTRIFDRVPTQGTHPSGPMDPCFLQTPSFREVKITSDSGPFLTHAIINSVTKLSLTNRNAWDQCKLKELFDQVQFRSLESFSFFSDWPPSPNIFLKFLYHHQSLIEVDLDVSFKHNQEWPQAQWASSRRPPTFPNLQILRTFAEVFQWLIQDVRQCPKLHTVTFKSSPTSLRGPQWYCGLQNAVSSTLCKFHSTPSMDWPLEAEIELLLGSFCLGSNPSTVLEHQCWSRISVLKLLDISQICSSTTGPDPTIAIKWLSNFPSMEHLEINSLSQEFGKEFVELLVVECPQLKSFGAPYRPSYEFCTEWQTWAVREGKVEDHVISCRLSFPPKWPYHRIP